VLVDTLKFTNLYRYFVAENIITLDEEEEISCESNSIKKIEIFLKKVSSSLKTGFTVSFYKMLDIMRIHGNLATKELARNIKKSIDDLKSHNGSYISTHIFYFELAIVVTVMYVHAEKVNPCYFSVPV